MSPAKRPPQPLQDAERPPAVSGRVIGLDLGDRRVGVALSNPARTIASPLEVLARSNRVHREVAELVAEWEATTVVVGLPLSLDGSIGPAASKALAEVKKLAATLAVPVETYDERLTTVTAERIMTDAGLDGRSRRKVVDKIAAAIMLQAWLDHEASTTNDHD
jgi:putative Holliday junction resolvase